MTHGTQAKLEGTAIAVSLTVIYSVLQAIVPIVQQYYPGLSWTPILLMLMATLGAIVPLASRWYHTDSPGQQLSNAVIAEAVTNDVPPVAHAPLEPEHLLPPVVNSPPG